MKYIKVKNFFDNILTESLNSDKNKAKRLINSLKKSKDFSTFYTVINNLQNGIVLNENYDLYLTLNKQMLSNHNLNDYKESTENINMDLNKLDEAINLFLFENQSYLNFNDYNNAEKIIIENLISNTKKHNDVINNEKKIKFINERINSLNDDDKLLIETTLKLGVINVYRQKIENCISDIKVKLKTNSDKELRYKLFEVKEIMEDKLMNENINIEDLVEIIEIQKEI